MSTNSTGPASSGSGGGSSSKKEEERKRQFIVTVLELPHTTSAHPIIGQLVTKYVKMPGHEDKAAFQLDMLRMLAMARAAEVDQ